MRVTILRGQLERLEKGVVKCCCVSPRGETAADESVKARIKAVKERRRAMARSADENFAKSVADAIGAYGWMQMQVPKVASNY